MTQPDRPSKQSGRDNQHQIHTRSRSRRNDTILDTLLVRKESGEVKLLIFWKNTHTNQYPHRPIPTQTNTHTDQYPDRPIPTQTNTHTDQYPHRPIPIQTNTHTDQYPYRPIPTQTNTHTDQYPYRPIPSNNSKAKGQSRITKDLRMG